MADFNEKFALPKNTFRHNQSSHFIIDLLFKIVFVDFSLFASSFAQFTCRAVNRHYRCATKTIAHFVWHFAIVSVCYCWCLTQHANFKVCSNVPYSIIISRWWFSNTPIIFRTKKTHTKFTFTTTTFAFYMKRFIQFAIHLHKCV